MYTYSKIIIQLGETLYPRQHHHHPRCKSNIVLKRDLYYVVEMVTIEIKLNHCCFVKNNVQFKKIRV